MIDYKQLYNFINNHALMVISSLGPKGQPQSAVVGFGQTKELRIIFGTDESSRKAKSLVENTRVSIVIGWDDYGTMQCEGEAQLLDSQEAKKYAELYFDKNPSARRFSDNPGQRYFIVKPKWIRYTDVSTDPYSTQEFEF